MKRRLAVLAVLLLVPALPARAWGPHSEITQAALSVLPEADRWKAELGAENLEAFTTYCLMPDMRGSEKTDYYIDDYLLIRALPRYVGHIAPDVKTAFVPHFKRSLQALRTETPQNACRQIGPLLHYVEDLGAPPHTGPGIADHGPLENWVRAADIAIAGYKPQRLGRTDDEALAGLLKRLDALQAFSAERAARAGPLVKKGETARPQVEPILLESANESARAAADLLYTLFSLGLEKGPAGAGLEGTVEAPAYFRNNEKGARIILLDNAAFEKAAKGTAAGNFAACATDFATLAATAAGGARADGWGGEFRFHNLPTGTVRVLACRPGARWAVSDPVALAAGKTAKVKLVLPPTEPPGNVVMNPDGRLRYLSPDPPDRWQQATAPDRTVVPGRAWVSAGVKAAGPVTYVCGAALKDPSVRVRFWFIRSPAPGAKQGPMEHADLAVGSARPAEVRYALDGTARCVVTVESDKPLADVIERVWVVPAGAASPK
jgi:hypothetical protein